MNKVNNKTLISLFCIDTIHPFYLHLLIILRKRSTFMIKIIITNVRQLGIRLLIQVYSSW